MVAHEMIFELRDQHQVLLIFLRILIQDGSHTQRFKKYLNFPGNVAWKIHTLPSHLKDANVHLVYIFNG